jgi:hypothetical protein
MSSPPISVMPVDGGQCILDTDCSDFATGAVLSRRQDDGVIAYASRSLSSPERKYCVTRQELLAVVYYLKSFLIRGITARQSSH